MGYYSDVQFVAAFPSPDKLTNFLAHRRITNWQYDQYTSLSNDEFTVSGQYLMYHDNSVKWYENYESVKWVELVFDDAVKWGAAASFHRIGEEVDDIQLEHFESDGNENDLMDLLWENFGVERQTFANVQGVSILEAMKQLGEDNETK